MPFFDHDGLKFHYVEAGAGRPFIFQHGLGGDTAQPLGLLRPPPGSRLIAFDCRGHGQTVARAGERLTFAALARDWLALMDHLHLTRTVAGGISLGAALALHVASAYPQRVQALVLVRPAWLDGPLPQGTRALYSGIASLIRRHGAQQAAAVFAASEACQALRQTSPAAAEAFLRQFESAQAETAVARLEELPGDTPHPRTAWAAVHVPALVLACRDDTLHPFEVAQALAAGLPQAQFKEVASRHTDPGRHAAEVQQAVEAFLAEREFVE